MLLCNIFQIYRHENKVGQFLPITQKKESHKVLSWIIWRKCMKSYFKILLKADIQNTFFSTYLCPHHLLPSSQIPIQNNKTNSRFIIEIYAKKSQHQQSKSMLRQSSCLRSTVKIFKVHALKLLPSMQCSHGKAWASYPIQVRGILNLNPHLNTRPVLKFLIQASQ